MSGKRFLLLVAVALAVTVFVLRRRTPPPAVHAPPPPPAAVKPPQPALQADAEGRYIPGYLFSVGRFRFTGFSLRPEAVVTFTSAGMEQPLFCPEAAINAATIRLRCEDPAVGVITIQGKFLKRLATNRLDTPVLSAVVTVRSGGGEILYSARDSFTWEPSH